MARHNCCVPHCHSLNKRDPVKFFKFPTTDRIRQAWILKVGRGPSFTVTTNTRICSKHFVKGRRSYIPEDVDYVPSIFPVESPPKEPKSRCRKCKRKVCSCKCTEMPKKRGRPRKNFGTAPIPESQNNVNDFDDVINDQCGNCGGELPLHENNHTFKTLLWNNDPLYNAEHDNTESVTLTVADALSLVFKIDLGEESLSNTPVCQPCCDILRSLHMLWSSFIEKTSHTAILHSFLKEDGGGGGGKILSSLEAPTRSKLKAKISRRLLLPSTEADGIKLEISSDLDDPDFEAAVPADQSQDNGGNDAIVAFNFVETKFGSFHTNNMEEIDKGEAEIQSSAPATANRGRKRKILESKQELSPPAHSALLGSTDSNSAEAPEVVTKRPLRSSASAALKLLREESPAVPSPSDAQNEMSDESVSDDDGSDFQPDDDLEATQIAIEKSLGRKRRDKTPGIPKPEICLECRQRFVTKKGLEAHQRQVHAEVRGPFICDVENCGRVFAGAKFLEGHRNGHFGIRPYICDQCGWATTGEDHLQRHMVKHLKPEEKELRKSKVCEVCGAKFIKTSALKFHMVAHSEERPFHCSYEGCASKFKMQSKRRQHEKEVHSNTAEITPCTRCGRQFNRRHNWKLHMDRHAKYDAIGKQMRKSRDPPIRDKLFPGLIYPNQSGNSAV